MSGHNKWSSIKHKKEAADSKRGKLFSRLAKEITLAAKAGGGDAAMNPRLRSAIAAGKAVNMPNDNIDRAVKKGTGELDGGALEELTYEGYGPGGVAVIVTCLSDNRNRTAADIRLQFARHNSNLAGSGAVSWMFQRKCRFLVEGERADEDELLEIVLDSGADVDDLTVTDGVAQIVAPPEAFAELMGALEGADVPIAQSSLILAPENTVLVTEAGVARQVVRLMEALEDQEDVQEVYSNFDMPDELMEQLAAE